MTTATIDATGIVSHDPDQAAARYRALGCDVPGPTPEAGGLLDPDGVRVDLYPPLVVDA